MAFPRKKLNSYEEVILDFHPHWWFLAGPVAALVAVIVGSIVVQVVWDPPAFITLVCVAALVVAAVMVGWSLWTWRTTYFVVTSDRLIFQAGVFAKHGLQIPLERVNDVSFRQSFFERILGTGDLQIESGSEQGQQRFSDIKHPENVQNVIHAQIESNENRKCGMAGSLSGQGVAGGTDVVTQLEKLEGLLQRGAISPDEFAAQKAKLLG